MHNQPHPNVAGSGCGEPPAPPPLPFRTLFQLLSNVIYNKISITKCLERAISVQSASTIIIHCHFPIEMTHRKTDLRRLSYIYKCCLTIQWYGRARSERRCVCACVFAMSNFGECMYANGGNMTLFSISICRMFCGAET